MENTCKDNHFEGDRGEPRATCSHSVHGLVSWRPGVRTSRGVRGHLGVARLSRLWRCSPLDLHLSWPPMRNSEAFALGSAHLRLSMWLLDFSSHDCSDVRWLRSLRVYASALAYMKVKESVIVWGSMDVCMCTVAGCLLMCGSCALLVGPITRFCNCSSCDQIGCGIVHLAGITARVFPSIHPRYPSPFQLAILDPCWELCFAAAT